MYIRDGQTLLGGVALVLTGAILTSLLQLYFEDAYTSTGFARARWWWEIAMSLQVLSIAFVWFCYSDKISESQGARRNLLQYLRLLSFIFVSLPFVIILMSTFWGWFDVRPPIAVVERIITVMVALWLTAVASSRFMRAQALNAPTVGEALRAFFVPKAWYALLPTGIVFFLWMFESLRGGILHYLYVPLLLYIQAAFPYIERGVGRRPVSTAAPQ